MNILMKSDINCMIVLSKQGIGKTTFVFEQMKERGLIEDKHYLYYNSYFTPLSFYKALEETTKLEGNQILILDDVEAILKNTNIINMLKSSTWENSYHQRVVNYNTTSSKVENQFLNFNGKIIILINEIPKKSPVFKAVIDRSLFVKLEFNNQQILDYMKEVIKKEYKEISYHKRKIVFDFIKQNTTDKTDLSLRTLIKGYNAFMYSPHNFKDLILMSLKENNNLIN